MGYFFLTRQMPIRLGQFNAQTGALPSLGEIATDPVALPGMVQRRALGLPLLQQDRRRLVGEIRAALEEPIKAQRWIQNISNKIFI